MPTHNDTTPMQMRPEYRSYALVLSNPMNFREWYIARQRYDFLARQEVEPDRHEVNALEHLLLEGQGTPG